MTTKSNEVLVDVQNLVKYFPVTAGILFQKKVADVKAVDDVSFKIHKGETLGMVGESGCGKTTVGRTMLQLYKPTSGSVIFEGNDLTTMAARDLRAMRRRMQMIFQDPYGSLNPRMSAGNIVGEPLVVHKMTRSRAEFKDQVDELLTVVGLSPYMGARFPHEFSGGQRQRIGVARALAVRPSFIVCDEPVSALDVSIQAQILNLLVKLQDKLNLTYLFISHDLSVIRHLADRIGIMYLGKIVEYGENHNIFDHPKHPYTRALLEAVPLPNPKIISGLKSAPGEIPNAINPPKGCSFHPRCLDVQKICNSKITHIKEINKSHYVSCHLYN